jgi:hypothetical protein
MTPGQPDVVNQIPATGNPMEPQSGSYGQVADLDRLKQQLSVPGGPGAGASPTPPPPPGAPQGQGLTPPPGGVPEVLMAPTTQPGVPPSTPLGGAPPAVSAESGEQRRMEALVQLATSPGVSVATREMAKAVLNRMGVKL